MGRYWLEVASVAATMYHTTGAAAMEEDVFTQLTPRGCDAIRGLPPLESGMAKLHEAVHEGRVELVDAILQRGLVNPSFHEDLLIRCAARAGLVHVVERLLADPRVGPATSTGTEVCGALTVAACEGHVAVVDRLLADSRVDPTRGGSEPLVFACRDGQLAVLERLLADPRLDPSVHSNKAVTSAALYDRAPVVAPLVYACSLFVYACSFDRMTTLQLLLSDPRIDVRQCGLEGLQQAAARSLKEVLDLLLRDPRIDAPDDAALHYVGFGVEALLAGTPAALRHCVAAGRPLLHDAEPAAVVREACRAAWLRRMPILHARERGLEGGWD